MNLNTYPLVLTPEQRARLPKPPPLTDEQRDDLMDTLRDDDVRERAYEARYGAEE